jgi:hypothetical protein
MEPPTLPVVQERAGFHDGDSFLLPARPAPHDIDRPERFNGNAVLPRPLSLSVALIRELLRVGHGKE